MVYLQAVETGCNVLTGNVREFDLFDQVLPGGGPILYRKSG